ATTRHTNTLLGGPAEGNAKGPTVLADVATSLQDLDRTAFAADIAAMEEKLSEKEGSVLDLAIARLDHFKVIQLHINSTAMH
ncbi:MAG: F0F1 ATP synthase subunit epsilon, partial [Tardiphaga sp.]|nr:F0F1 ATP synthase subunit epsilon [Tardiphaga sp.]